MVHRLKTSVTIPLGIHETFAFFADASNLEKITPAELYFNILTPQPIEITEGTEIDYRLRLYGVRLKWRSRITNWSPPHRFVDEQVHGPYNLWVHNHRFHEENGSTTIMDEVWYRLPLYPFGEVVYPIVSGLLHRIFHFRKQAIWNLLCGENERKTK
jgi:ligand-binding SRPBCC domain-containing protein